MLSDVLIIVNPVYTLCVFPLKSFNILIASSTSWGLPNISFPYDTTVSAPITKQLLFNVSATAYAFCAERDITMFSTELFVSICSLQSLIFISNSRPRTSIRLLRLGDADAKISFICLLSFCLYICV